MGRVPGLVLATWCCIVAVACGGGGGHKKSPWEDDEIDMGSTSGGTSAGSGGSAGTEMTPMAGAPAGGDECLIGKSCECESGLVGSSICVDDVEMCDCSACPAPPVDSAPAFVACGGEPFGIWGAAEVDMTVVKHLFISSTGAAEVWCPTADPQYQPVVFMLRLDDGGTGANYFSGFSGTFSVLDSCIEPAGNCTDFPGCVRGACGTCVCESVPDVVEGDITWVRNDTELSVTIGTSVITVEYCVQGDTMTLKTTDDSDTVYTLKRGYPHGTPVDCDMRELDQCASTGCHVGVCTGGGACAEGIDETSCTNRAGCSWDATQCAGTVAEECAFGDYGTTPGCEFSESAVCSGTPEPCDTKLDIYACDAAPGCYWGAAVGCNGTVGECAEVPLDICESVAGCAITPG